MEKSFLPKEKFKNSAEEISFITEKLEERRKNPENIFESPEKAVKEELDKYSSVPTKEVLSGDYALSENNMESIVLELSPEKHDTQIEELLSLLQDRGIKNTLSVVKKMDNKHLEDDLHRFLVQYIKTGYPINIKEKDPLLRALKKSLFEITLPQSKSVDKPLSEIVSSMEQFYAGMFSISDASNYGKIEMALEIAVPHFGEEVIFYVSVPDDKAELFEKQFLSVFPEGRIFEKKDDYNIFNEEGVSIASRALLKKSFAYPFKTYDKFDYDPLNIVLNAFSKLQKEGEGASLQIIFNPVGDKYNTKLSKAIEKISNGAPIKEAVSFDDSILSGFGKVFKDLSKTKKDGEVLKPVSQEEFDSIKTKAQSPIISSNFRLVVSAWDMKRAEIILHEIESSFNQFDSTIGNNIIWKRLKGGLSKRFIRDYTFRRYNKDDELPLSLKELATIYHFPKDNTKASPHLKQSKALTAPAPSGMVDEGILLGVNDHRELKKNIFYSKDDRLRHFYCVGQTGTGKTTLLKNMIVQDIENGDGVCVIDPHGSDIEDILSNIPKERMEDVIYFDPASTDCTMSLNMLEIDSNYPEQKTFVVNEMLSIFDKLFDMKTAGGPMFEQYFRNAVLLSMSDPARNATLLDVSRVLSDKNFRDLMLSKNTNPIVGEFWKNIAEKAGGEASLSNIVPYITSKFDVFLTNDIMRPIIAGSKSSFNFREVMDNRKILLVNLSKGRLGDINSNLIGLIIVGKILMASLGRIDSVSRGEEIHPFYLYIDEFHNVTTPSIATILSEARKYKLSLNIAHQFIAQLNENIRDAVFGNVGTIAAFRVGSDDAKYLEKIFEPVFEANDLINIDNRNAYLKMLVAGKPERPFSLKVNPPKEGDVSVAVQLKQISCRKYGRQRNEIEAEVSTSYKGPEL